MATSWTRPKVIFVRLSIKPSKLKDMTVMLRKKAHGYLQEADYYSRNKKFDKANTYTEWTNEVSTKTL